MARTDEALGRVEFFEGLSARELKSIARLMTRLEVREGRTLVREGSVGREFFVIIDGEAEVTRNGRRINHLGPGATFGEAVAVEVWVVDPVAAERRGAVAPDRLAVAADDLGVALQTRLGRLHAVHGPLEHDVHHDQVGPCGACFGNGIGTRERRANHLTSHMGQTFGDVMSDDGLVVDHENASFVGDGGGRRGVRAAFHTGFHGM